MVRYWSMEVLDGSFRRNREVDEVSWFAPEDVAGILTFQHDIAVVSALYSEVRYVAVA